MFSKIKNILKLIVLNITMLVLIVLLLFLIYNNIILYSSNEFSQDIPENGVKEQLNYLNEILKEGAASEMQKYYPEGFVFTNAIYGLACTEYTRYKNISKNEKEITIKRAEWTLNEINSQKGLQQFLINKDLIPEYGIFYRGWRNLLNASILRVKSKLSNYEINNFKTECDIIFNYYNNSNNLYLPSYKWGVWPADNFTAIASLAIHDQIFEPKYQEFIKSWLRKVDLSIDLKTGLIPHSVKIKDNSKIESARGSSQALILRLLTEIDLKTAEKYYSIFKNNFKDEVFGFPGIREYEIGVNGDGDIDSGPLIFEIGLAATIVSIGTSRAVGDSELFDGLSKATELLGFPINFKNKKKYIFGLVPMSDAFICWSIATYPRGNNYIEGEIGHQFLIVSTLLILLILFLLYKLKTKLY